MKSRSLVAGGPRSETREDRREERRRRIPGPVSRQPGLLSSSLSRGPEGAGEEVWQQATHLYGSLALRRGLAAGEVVEELQLLRGVILRLLLEAPPEDWGDRGFQRDLLALNKLLDLGVVRASVAYVDDLFFAHLQGSGVPEGVTAEVEEEMKQAVGGLSKRARGSEGPASPCLRGRSNGQG